MHELEIKPGRWPYAVAVLVPLVGAALFALILWKGLSGLAESNQRVVVPGSGEIVLREPGPYVVYHEFRSVVDGRVYVSEEALSGLECMIVEKGTGSRVALRPSTVGARYTLGSVEGVSIFEFAVESPGVYEISGGYGDSARGPQTVLSVGKDISGTLLMTIFGSLAVLFVSLITGLIIAVVTFLRRYRARKEINARRPGPDWPRG